MSLTVKRSAWSIRPLRDVLVAGEAGQDRQAGRVGGRPAGRAKLVRAEIEDRARAGLPATAAGRVEGEQLVELAAVAVDDQRVPVAVRAAAALDRDVRRDRVRALVRLVRVLERDAGLRLRAADDRDRDPDRPAFPEPGAEVGVHVVVDADRRRRSGRSWERPAACRRAGSTGSWPGRPGTREPAAACRRKRRRRRARARRGRAERVVLTEAETPRPEESCPPAASRAGRAPGSRPRTRPARRRSSRRGSRARSPHSSRRSARG